MHNIVWPSTCRVLIGKWSKVYKGSFNNKPTFHHVWKASSKFVCWQLWLARNKAIFKNKLILPSSVVAHVMGQLGEYLTSRRIKVEKIEQLEKEEELWMSKMNVKISFPLKLPKDHSGSFMLHLRSITCVFLLNKIYPMCLTGHQKETQGRQVWEGCCMALEEIES
jgi:hypothetical protein